jgi:glycosyltransferase involved in cell wall biosynthesis
LVSRKTQHAVYTGAFNHDKGVLRVQEAALQIPELKMIYIGGGKDEPEGNNILFKGRVAHDKVPLYLSAADFFVLPTLAEGCCNAIIEAMACGLPIISSIGAYNDDILSDEYSIRVDPNDVAAISSAMKMLTDDKDKTGDERMRVPGVVAL